MSAIGRELSSVIANAVGGFLIGSTTDMFGPSSGSVDDSNWIKATAEVAAHLTIDGMLATAWFDFATRRGFNGGSALSLPFIIAFMATEQNLLAQIGNLSSFYKSKLTTVIGNAPSVSSSDVKSTRPQSLPVV
jgi:hypothetical protein